MSNQGWARLFARSIVGLTFFMAGWGKVFHLTVMMHAERGFVGPYAETWIPTFLERLNLEAQRVRDLLDAFSVLVLAIGLGEDKALYTGVHEDAKAGPTGTRGRIDRCPLEPNPASGALGKSVHLGMDRTHAVAVDHVVAHFVAMRHSAH